MAKKKKVRDFAKVKLKVGKKLKKTAQTDTTIKAKKVVLVEQLTHGGDVVSHRGLSLDELCRQLGHYNLNIRRDAIVGIKQLLTANPHLISSHLHTLIPSIARLICDEKADSAFRAQLRALLELLCQTPSLVMSSYFELFLAHVLLALTHLKLFIRIFAVSVVVLLMRVYPDLCKNRNELFDTLVGVMSSQKKPSNKELLIGVLNSILNVFAMEEKKRLGPLYTGTFSIDANHVSRIDLTMKPASLHFTVLGPNVTRGTSPLKTREGLLRFSAVAFPILETVLIDEKAEFDEQCAEIVAKIGCAFTSIQQEGGNKDFNQQFAAIINPLRILVNKKRSSKSLRTALSSLIVV